jgi:DNA replication initiation complex subunit (GINS family)
LSTIEIEDAGPVGTSALSVDVSSDGAMSSPRHATLTPDKAKPVVEMGLGHTLGERQLSDAAKERVAALRNGGSAAPPPAKAAPPEPATEPGAEPEATVEDVLESAEDAPADEAAPDQPAEAQEATADWEAERAELEAVRERQRAIIAKLQSDLDSAKKATPTRDTSDEDELYARSPTKAFRQWVAQRLGKSPDDKEVESEVLDFFIDLTSEVSGAQPDPSHAAKRNSALIRRELDLPKNRRRDETPKTAESTPSKEEKIAASVPIVKQLFAPIASKYPHLAVAADLDGAPPEHVLADVIMRGYETGDFDPNDKDEVTIEKAAKKAEQFYQQRLEKIRARIPGTATPGVTATVQKTPAAQPGKPPQRTGTQRSIGNADASVAPAQTPPTKDEKPPVFKTDAERKHWALRHLRPGGT